MQEDKKLKELLGKHAVEETSDNFTSTVMLQIQSVAAAKKYATPLLKQKLMQVLLVAFILVCIMLLVLSIFMQPSQLPLHFSINLQQEYFLQIIYFLIAFWVVMFINQLWNKKRGEVL